MQHTCCPDYERDLMAPHHRRIVVLGFVSWMIVGSAAVLAAWEPRAARVADNVYALIGETGPRTVENFALNANLGFIVTDEGVILVDSGALRQFGPVIEGIVARLTEQPIRWVINLGAQDHRWLGNGYFAERGAEIIALECTVQTQLAYAESHRVRLQELFGDAIDDVKPMTAPSPIAADRAELTLGGVRLDLLWLGDAHYRGDALLWLPETGVLFAGDLVFMDRMLGIWPHSDIRGWRATFHAMAALEPTLVVPGHGDPGDLAKAWTRT
jgi:glyoxylase-like metal-dependent hydrolase (beta-lactamase superfamily II)